jgi:hypothetical protein
VGRTVTFFRRWWRPSLDDQGIIPTLSGWVSLHTGDSQRLVSAPEVADPAYRRMPARFFVISPGRLTNTKAITFPQPTRPWGPTHWALWDAPRGGRIVCAGPLGTVEERDPLGAAHFAEGAIVIDLDMHPHRATR